VSIHHTATEHKVMQSSSSCVATYIMCFN